MEDFGENEDEEDPEEKNGVLCQAKNTGDGLPKGKKKKKKQKKQKKQVKKICISVLEPATYKIQFALLILIGSRFKSSGYSWDL